jgi:two-component system, chemotaxis family, response regulator WspR
MTEMTNDSNNPIHKSSRAIVLLVDDQMMIAEGIRRMLVDAEDIEYHYCEDPFQAVKKATEIGATTILQDLVMPDIDGMTLVRFYRANPATKDVPIIVLSSKEDPEVKRDAFENGATDYLVKLPDKIELIARIRHHTKSYVIQQERDEAFAALHKMQQQLQDSNSTLEEANAELQRLSSLDGLTGLSNRRHFDEIFETEWLRALREKEEISIIMMDIDHFKLYNDHYGHLGGDDCLKKVATALKDCMKRPGDLVARYGGEEFVVVLPNTPSEGAKMIAEKIRFNVFDQKLEHAESKTAEFVSISLGTATAIPTEDMKTLDLVATADKGLYFAKEQGRNCVGVDPDE